NLFCRIPGEHSKRRDRAGPCPSCLPTNGLPGYLRVPCTYGYRLAPTDRGQPCPYGCRGRYTGFSCSRTIRADSYISITQLTAYPLMFNEPADKVETTIFCYHLAIFDLLSNMILHLQQFKGLVLCKTPGEEVLKLCTLCSIELFWHSTIAPSSSYL